MKHRFAVLVIIVILTSSLAGGFLGTKVSAGSAPADQASSNEFIREFTEAIDVIQKNHVDNISADKLVYSAIKGMLRTLDPHSSFFDPEEFARLPHPFAEVVAVEPARHEVGQAPRSARAGRRSQLGVPRPPKTRIAKSSANNAAT